jgi:proline iminopeptidase
MKPDFYLNTFDGHELAVYTRGKNKQNPLFFLHGGPGGEIVDESFSFFNLNDRFVIAFDQRGCGNSKPFLSLVNNDIDHSIEDIEAIRNGLGIDKFTLFGGSYGSTFALVYAIKYKEHVSRLVLRGVFLARNEDVKWLYQEGASYFYPEEFHKFSNFLKEKDRSDIVSNYRKIFSGSDDEIKERAFLSWSRREMSVVKLLKSKDKDEAIRPIDRSLALLECYYFVKGVFKEDNYILDNINKIEELETYIVHGRYDIDCRLAGAYELTARFKNAKLYISEKSGHSPFESNTFKILKEIFVELSK